MNSQIVEINSALRSKFAFLFLAALIPPSLFLRPGFVSVSVIWFFALCIYNCRSFRVDAFKEQWHLLFLLLLYFLYVIGLGYSHNLDVGVNLVFRKIHLMLLPVAFLLAGRKVTSGQLHNTTLGIFLLSCLVASSICLINAVVSVIEHGAFGLQKGDVYYSYFCSHLLIRPLKLDPVYLSLYGNFALLITLTGRVVRKISQKVVIGIFLVGVILLCGSQAGLVSMCVIGLVALLAARIKLAMGAAMFISILLLVILFVSDRASLMEPFTESAQFTYSDDKGDLSDYRANKLRIWDSALEAIKKNPIVGYGTGDGQQSLEKEYREQGLTDELSDSLNAHNEFLSTALDIGVFGVVCLTLMLVLPLVRAVRERDPLAIGFLLMMVIFFCIESVLLRQKGIVFFAFFYSIVVFRMTSQRNEAIAP